MLGLLATGVGATAAVFGEPADLRSLAGALILARRVLHGLRRVRGWTMVVSWWQGTEVLGSVRLGAGQIRARGAFLRGLYSAATYELTPENVDRVLDDVRPYLISDGGNVTVVAVEDGVISLKLEGACGSCPSSTTTMNMGIERVLKEKFGDAFKEIRQVFDGDQPAAETTPEAVNRHLDILRPAIANYGGSVDVLAVDGEDCLVRYDGPESIGSGIKAAIKEKFPDITNVVFTL